MPDALDAALELFWQRGYEATSMADLRAATGLSSASLYAAFGSKQHLFAAVVEHYMKRFGSMREPVKNPGLSAREAIEQTLRASLRVQIDRSHPLGCLIVLGGMTAGTDNDEVRRLLAAQRATDRQDFQKRVQRAVDDGELSSNVDAARMATVFTTFLWGISVEARDETAAEDLEAAIDQLMSIWDASAGSVSAAD